MTLNPDISQTQCGICSAAPSARSLAGQSTVVMFVANAITYFVAFQSGMRAMGSRAAATAASLCLLQVVA